MTTDEILVIFSRILRDLLSDDSIVLTPEATREDVPNWDSLSYVSFIVAVEMELGVKFGVADVESFDTVGAVARRTQELMEQQTS